jgi:hypothetical protein
MRSSIGQHGRWRADRIDPVKTARFLADMTNDDAK